MGKRAVVEPLAVAAQKVKAQLNLTVADCPRVVIAPSPEGAVGHPHLLRLASCVPEALDCGLRTNGCQVLVCTIGSTSPASVHVHLRRARFDGPKIYFAIFLTGALGLRRSEALSSTTNRCLTLTDVQKACNKLSTSRRRTRWTDWTTKELLKAQKENQS